MSEAIYPGQYRDAVGTEDVLIRNDGKTLRVRIRGIELAGDSFDMLEPVEDAGRAEAAGFRLCLGDLCACELSCELPIPITPPDATVRGVLRMHLVLGVPDHRNRLDRETLELELRFGDQTVRSSGKSGWFEDELLDLQRQLPEGTFMRACINCAFSDYSPYGHGLFGFMACFRGNKDGYRTVHGKGDLFRIWDTLTGLVQETWLCPEFERRKPNTGYRG